MNWIGQWFTKMDFFGRGGQAWIVLLVIWAVMEVQRFCESWTLLELCVLLIFGGCVANLIPKVIEYYVQVFMNWILSWLWNFVVWNFQREFIRVVSISNVGILVQHSDWFIFIKEWKWINVDILFLFIFFRNLKYLRLLHTWLSFLVFMFCKV